MIEEYTDVLKNYILHAEEIILTRDIESNQSLFVFFSINKLWHQLYFDMGMLFINPIHQDIRIYLDDIDQNIINTIPVEKNKLELSYDIHTKKIHIEGCKISLKGKVVNDCIIL
ncbi:MAG: hypothetical protein KGV56_03940 [Gammaproteobacteria bacterium]|nr:hypothetical protein [Gammaproteobacteria bacterium]